MFMFRRLAVCAILALGAASAESYDVRIIQPSVIKGTELKPGEYRMNLENDKVTFKKGKQTIEAQVKVETSDKKYETTSVRYEGTSIQAICIGGTKTKVIFSN